MEGGNRWNDWWEYEQRGALPFRSGDACNQFELYEADFDMARGWGHTAHRLSLEWSRMEPEEGRWDLAAVEHYRRVLRALRDRGIEPVVTLHHFTNPAWFARRGGWVPSDSVALFTRYVAFIVDALGEDVRWWITLNEPTVFVKRAYSVGDWPPCQPRSPWSGIRALRNMHKAHKEAYHTIHARWPQAMVGFSHSAPYVVACDPSRRLDRWAAVLRDFVLNRSGHWMLGPRRARTCDFIGINYYARQVARWRPKGLGWLFGTECREDHHGEPRHFSALGWEVYAPGFTRVLQRFGRFGLPIMVTENGIATENEAERLAFLTGHLDALAAAVASGVDVRGYLFWSLIDNYEWAQGFAPRFGLAHVDFSTQRRTSRPAAEAFASYIRACEDARHGKDTRHAS